MTDTECWFGACVGALEQMREVENCVYGNIRLALWSSRTSTFAIYQILCKCWDIQRTDLPTILKDLEIVLVCQIENYFSNDFERIFFLRKIIYLCSNKIIYQM